MEDIVVKGAKFVEENKTVVGAGSALALVLGYFAFRRQVMGRDVHDYDNQFTGATKILNNADHVLKGKEFEGAADKYMSRFDGARTGAVTDSKSIEVRKEEYGSMVDEFYHLVTDFYEWGWGQSFHFGPRYITETFDESIKRTEYHLCSRLHMKPGMKVIDVGCGVGGPMRNMAMFSGATIEGITINEYQVKIGNKYNENLGLSSICHLTQGDFQNQPWPDKTFDAAYEIEATCHSPDRVRTYGEVARVLKPGAYFAGYEWVMTDKYDPKNKDHVRVKEGIEEGNGLPTLVHYKQVMGDLEAAGFEVVEHYDANRDVHKANNIPWYATLDGKFTLSGFRMTFMGRMCTHSMVWVLETIGIAAPGSTKVSAFLNATALDLCESGRTEIFTPSYYFLARKK